MKNIKDHWNWKKIIIFFTILPGMTSGGTTKLIQETTTNKPEAKMHNDFFRFEWYYKSIIITWWQVVSDEIVGDVAAQLHLKTGHTENMLRTTLKTIWQLPAGIFFSVTIDSSVLECNAAGFWIARLFSQLGLLSRLRLSPSPFDMNAIAIISIANLYKMWELFAISSWDAEV